VIELPLERPLGSRRLIVNGTEWVELGPTCPHGTLGNPDLDLPDDRCAPRSTDP
jgi:hypothetical protein